MNDSNAAKSESLRIKAEYERREIEIEPELYAPWQPAEILLISERKRIAALMLKSLDRFPSAGSRCLEIGYGKLGWLADLLSWGIDETDLHGIELDAVRAARAQKALPQADLKVGDATQLPWRTDYFNLVVASTVYSSILDQSVREMISKEISRVVSPDGTVILYDMAVGNPRNNNLRAVKYDEVRAMFPDFKCYFKSVTLAPPIARAIAKRSWTLAVLLSSLPFLRTHFVAILVKQ